MSSVNIKIKPLREDCRLPERKTSGSACFDVFASHDVSMEPNATRIIKTGFSMQLPPGVEGQIRPRSGLAAKHSITVLNAPGTIDSDYRGEVKVLLINHGKKTYKIKKGDSIAQIAIRGCGDDNLVFLVTDCLEETTRGEGGFGSTGR